MGIQLRMLFDLPNSYVHYLFANNQWVKVGPPLDDFIPLQFLLNTSPWICQAMYFIHLMKNVVEREVTLLDSPRRLAGIYPFTIPIQSAIALASDPVFYARTKHIEVRLSFYMWETFSSIMSLVNISLLKFLQSIFFFLLTLV